MEQFPVLLKYNRNENTEIYFENLIEWKNAE